MRAFAAAVMIPMASVLILVAAGCGWSPSSGNQAQPNTCTAEQGPSTDTVNAEIARLSGGQQWRESARGNTTDCRLYWVQIASAAPASDAPGQVLFFDGGTPIGTPTPDPRPYIAVVNSSPDTVTVQYQWRQGADKACCPTGIGTVRFQLADDGLKALDPIPGPQP
jgi:hypothetical protein